MAPPKRPLKTIENSHITHEEVEANAKISDFAQLSSYTWAILTISPLLPSGSKIFPEDGLGTPRTWCPPPGSIKLGLAPSTSYRDHEHSLTLENEMDPAVNRIQLPDKSFVTSAIDIFASDHTLKNLIKFVQGDDTPFQVLAQKINKTLFMVEKSSSAKTQMGLTRSLREAYTKWPESVRKSASHQRLVQYSFKSLKCVVRFEADGCLSQTDHLMATALISDIFVRPQPGPPVLKLSTQASRLGSADIFSTELSKPPEVTEAFSIRAPTAGYHWSQVEVLASDVLRKEADKQRKKEEEAEKKALEVARSRKHIPKRVWDEAFRSQPALEAWKPDAPRQSETSAILQHNNFLKQRPVANFRAITRAEPVVAQYYLDMAEGGFKQALDLYAAAQTNKARGSSMNVAPTTEQDVLVDRITAAASVSPEEAKKYLSYCHNDYEKALRLHETKTNYLDGVVLSRRTGRRIRARNHNRPEETYEDEAVYLRVFEDEEKNRRVGRLQEQVARRVKSAKIDDTVPHSALFVLHCAPEKSAEIPLKLSDDESIRLWITRVPSVITAYHDSQANVTSITYTDVRSQVRDWECQNQHVLARLSSLLKEVKEFVDGDRKVLLCVKEKGRMEVHDASETDEDVLSQPIQDLWHDQDGQETDTDVGADDNDDVEHDDYAGVEDEHDADDDNESHDEDDIDNGNNSMFGEDDDEDQEAELPADQNEKLEEEQEKYASDESSDWEREFDDSDEDNDNDRTRGSGEKR
ncbi:hypothetical protein AUEXF2481DRAFT_6291 [Aureobasidium subglaciale EXF-2481]|uniref:Uncharacterized protein n=1 Tax=Aureobasidium subglaciale (strain EXF-2481) TaxID=1043005 RepID=A0A074Y7E4_AURSE|nr:uncharacterized protein AUEXF2481DRAFT_6291 [Aureobasidium subglaciale EXF-2481]KEQ93698.1 hypothetical protein AUEXF2481DRAFT_6291 [Aureobasidium subglaciale EXF-2481]